MGRRGETGQGEEKKAEEEEKGKSEKEEVADEGRWNKVESTP